MSTFLKEASDYLQALSVLHVDILHSSNNVAFCRFQDQSQFSQLTLNASRNVVIVGGFRGKAAGGFDEEAVKNVLTVRFSCYAKTVSSADIVAASEKALAILLQYWRRMMKDYNADDCLWMKGIEWENISFDEIDQPWLVNHYGWDLIIPYKTNLPEFDENKWTDTIPVP
jgi:hypothetical protein